MPTTVRIKPAIMLQLVPGIVSLCIPDNMRGIIYVAMFSGGHENI